MQSIVKFIVAVAGAAVVALQSYINGPDGIQWSEAIQVAIAAFAAADVWLTANVPGARAAKAVVMAGASALGALAAHYATGGNMDTVHWGNVALMAIASVFVYLAPNTSSPQLTRR